MLAQWHVEFRTRRRGRRRLPYIADYADDGHPLVHTIKATHDAVAERVLRGKLLACQRLTDDDDRRTFVGVAVAKLAAAQHRDAERLEIVGTSVVSQKYLYNYRDIWYVARCVGSGCSTRHHAATTS